MPTLKLWVEGMAGGEDGARVERLVCAEPGVFGAVASPRSRCLEVDLEDDEESIGRIVAILEAAGFSARLAG